MLLPAGISANFTAVFNAPTAAFVALSVYDDSGDAPVLLLSPVQMKQVKDNVFSGKFTPAAGKLYVVFMAVYTDATFGTLDPAFKTAEQSVPVTGQYLTPPVQSVVGVVACGNDGQAKNSFNIFQGDAKTIYLLAQNAHYNNQPVDLTDCDEIDIVLPNADGTLTHLKLSDEDVDITQPPVLGAFSSPISEAVSALLNIGEFQNIDVTFTIAANVFTVRFYGALSVFEVA